MIGFAVVDSLRIDVSDKVELVIEMFSSNRKELVVDETESCESRFRFDVRVGRAEREGVRE